MAIKTQPTKNIPKYVDLVIPQTLTRTSSVSRPKGRTFHNFHTELIKTYRYKQKPAFLNITLLGHSSGPINSRHNIKIRLYTIKPETNRKMSKHIIFSHFDL